LDLWLSVVTSATIAVLRLILALNTPPTILAKIKRVKLWDTAQRAYEMATPACE
jgi:hypothetical protein